MTNRAPWSAVCRFMLPWPGRTAPGMSGRLCLALAAPSWSLPHKRWAPAPAGRMGPPGPARDPRKDSPRTTPSHAGPGDAAALREGHGHDHEQPLIGLARTSHHGLARPRSTFTGFPERPAGAREALRHDPTGAGLPHGPGLRPHYGITASMVHHCNWS